jgi:hypothetical protein
LKPSQPFGPLDRCQASRQLWPHHSGNLIEVNVERNDILNIGGFNDAEFKVVASFLCRDAVRFVREVESVEL